MSVPEAVAFLMLALIGPPRARSPFVADNLEAVFQLNLARVELQLVFVEAELCDKQPPVLMLAYKAVCDMHVHVAGRRVDMQARKARCCVIARPSASSHPSRISSHCARVSFAPSPSALRKCTWKSAFSAFVAAQFFLKPECLDRIADEAAIAHVE